MNSKKFAFVLIAAIALILNPILGASAWDFSLPDLSDLFGGGSDEPPPQPEGAKPETTPSYQLPQDAFVFELPEVSLPSLDFSLPSLTDVADTLFDTGVDFFESITEPIVNNPVYQDITSSPFFSSEPQIQDSVYYPSDPVSSDFNLPQVNTDFFVTDPYAPDTYYAGDSDIGSPANPPASDIDLVQAGVDLFAAGQNFLAQTFSPLFSGETPTQDPVYSPGGGSSNLNLPEVNTNFFGNSSPPADMPYAGSPANPPASDIDLVQAGVDLFAAGQNFLAQTFSPLFSGETQTQDPVYNPGPGSSELNLPQVNTNFFATGSTSTNLSYTGSPATGSSSTGSSASPAASQGDLFQAGLDLFSAGQTFLAQTFVEPLSQMFSETKDAVASGVSNAIQNLPASISSTSPMSTDPASIATDNLPSAAYRADYSSEESAFIATGSNYVSAQSQVKQVFSAENGAQIVAAGEAFKQSIIQGPSSAGSPGQDLQAQGAGFSFDDTTIASPLSGGIANRVTQKPSESGASKMSGETEFLASLSKIDPELARKAELALHDPAAFSKEPLSKEDAALIDFVRATVASAVAEKKCFEVNGSVPDNAAVETNRQIVRNQDVDAFAKSKGADPESLTPQQREIIARAIEAAAAHTTVTQSYEPEPDAQGAASVTKFVEDKKIDAILKNDETSSVVAGKGYVAPGTYRDQAGNKVEVVSGGGYEITDSRGNVVSSGNSGAFGNDQATRGLVLVSDKPKTAAADMRGSVTAPPEPSAAAELSGNDATGFVDEFYKDPRNKNAPQMDKDFTAMAMNEYAKAKALFDQYYGVTYSEGAAQGADNAAQSPSKIFASGTNFFDWNSDGKIDYVDVNQNLGRLVQDPNGVVAWARNQGVQFDAKGNIVSVPEQLKTADTAGGYTQTDIDTYNTVSASDQEGAKYKNAAAVSMHAITTYGDQNGQVDQKMLVDEVNYGGKVPDSIKAQNDLTLSEQWDAAKQQYGWAAPLMMIGAVTNPLMESWTGVQAGSMGSKEWGSGLYTWTGGTFNVPMVALLGKSLSDPYSTQSMSLGERATYLKDHPLELVEYGLTVYGGAGLIEGALARTGLIGTTRTVATTGANTLVSAEKTATLGSRAVEFLKPSLHAPRVGTAATEIIAGVRNAENGIAAGRAALGVVSKPTAYLLGTSKTVGIYGGITGTLAYEQARLSGNLSVNDLGQLVDKNGKLVHMDGISATLMGMGANWGNFATNDKDDMKFAQAFSEQGMSALIRDLTEEYGVEKITGPDGKETTRVNWPGQVFLVVPQYAGTILAFAEFPSGAIQDMAYQTRKDGIIGGGTSALKSGWGVLSYEGDVAASALNVFDSFTGGSGQKYASGQFGYEAAQSMGLSWLSPEDPFNAATPEYPHLAFLVVNAPVSMGVGHEAARMSGFEQSVARIQETALIPVNIVPQAKGAITSRGRGLLAYGKEKIASLFAEQKAETGTAKAETSAASKGLVKEQAAINPENKGVETADNASAKEALAAEQFGGIIDTAIADGAGINVVYQWNGKNVERTVFPTSREGALIMADASEGKVVLRMGDAKSMEELAVPDGCVAAISGVSEIKQAPQDAKPVVKDNAKFSVRTTVTQTMRAKVDAVLKQSGDKGIMAIWHESLAKREKITVDDVKKSFISIFEEMDISLPDVERDAALFRRENNDIYIFDTKVGEVQGDTVKLEPVSDGMYSGMKDYFNANGDRLAQNVKERYAGGIVKLDEIRQSPEKKKELLNKIENAFNAETQDPGVCAEVIARELGLPKTEMISYGEKAIDKYVTFFGAKYIESLFRVPVTEIGIVKKEGSSTEQFTKKSVLTEQRLDEILSQMKEFLMQKADIANDNKALPPGLGGIGFNENVIKGIEARAAEGKPLDLSTVEREAVLFGLESKNPEVKQRAQNIADKASTAEAQRLKETGSQGVFAKPSTDIKAGDQVTLKKVALTGPSKIDVGFEQNGRLASDVKIGDFMFLQGPDGAAIMKTSEVISKETKADGTVVVKTDRGSTYEMRRLQAEKADVSNHTRATEDLNPRAEITTETKSIPIDSQVVTLKPGESGSVALQDGQIYAMRIGKTLCTVQRNGDVLLVLEVGGGGHYSVKAGNEVSRKLQEGALSIKVGLTEEGSLKVMSKSGQLRITVAEYEWGKDYRASDEVENSAETRSPAVTALPEEIGNPSGTLHISGGRISIDLKDVNVFSLPKGQENKGYLIIPLEGIEKNYTRGDSMGNAETLSLDLSRADNSRVLPLLEKARSVGANPKLSERDKAMLVSQIVLEAFGGFVSSERRAEINKRVEELTIQYGGREVGFDVFLNEQAGVCRHYSTLYYVLAKEAGLNVMPVRGTTGDGKHQWNELILGDNRRILVDVYNHVFEEGYENVAKELDFKETLDVDGQLMDSFVVSVERIDNRYCLVVRPGEGLDSAHGSLKGEVHLDPNTLVGEMIGKELTVKDGVAYFEGAASEKQVSNERAKAQEDSVSARDRGDTQKAIQAGIKLCDGQNYKNTNPTEAAQQVLDLWVLIDTGPRNDKMDQYDRRRFERMLEGKDPATSMFVYEDPATGKITGYVTVERNPHDDASVTIKNIAVADSQPRGVGTALWQAAVDGMKARGIQKFEAIALNDASANIARKAGFEEIGRNKNEIIFRLDVSDGGAKQLDGAAMQKDENKALRPMTIEKATLVNKNNFVAVEMDITEKNLAVMQDLGKQIFENNDFRETVVALFGNEKDGKITITDMVPLRTVKSSALDVLPDEGHISELMDTFGRQDKQLVGFMHDHPVFTELDIGNSPMGLVNMRKGPSRQDVNDLMLRDDDYGRDLIGIIIERKFENADKMGLVELENFEMNYDGSKDSFDNLELYLYRGKHDSNGKYVKTSATEGLTLGDVFRQSSRNPGS